MSELDRVNDIGVSVKIDGKTIDAIESYEVTASVFEQPAAFCVRVGWSGMLSKLLETVKPLQKFELSILPDKGQTGNSVKVMTGLIDSVGVPSDGNAALEIRGRDMLSRLMRCTIRADESFASQTYRGLTEKVLDKIYGDYVLTVDNLANRKIWTGVSGLRAGRGTSKATVLVIEQPGKSQSYATVKARLGDSWLEFLRRQYKKVGLFLWGAADGSFVLSEPDLTQPPVAKIARTPAIVSGMFDPATCQIVQHEYHLDMTRRHARARVWGRAGGADGRTKIHAQYDDSEAQLLGLDPEIDSIDIHDPDVKTVKEAEYFAARWITDERRESFRLGYMLSGHTTPSLIGGGRAVWAPDVMVEVNDSLLAISGQAYVHSVTFSGPPRITRVQLSRATDLVFGE